MATDKPLSQLRLEYEEAAQAYLRSLPPEHFMESVTQSTQRKITVESEHATEDLVEPTSL